MAYNNVIGRADVAGLIPTEFSNEILTKVEGEESHLMRLGRKLRRMTRYEKTMPVLSALSTAYFPGGDTGLVETSEVNWENVTITAEDLAVVVPIPKNVLSDSNIPIWAEIMPDMVEAAGKAIDNAQLYGTNKPSTWPTAIITAATSASHVIEKGSGTDLYEELLDESGVWALVETDGFMVTGAIAHLTMKGALRGTRDANGQPIFNRAPETEAKYTIDGAPTFFPTNGSTSSSYPLIAGDWKSLVYSMRQDVSFDVFREGVITDAAGNIVYNLMQQRMAAIMLTMRLGFALPNPPNRVNETEATRYPFAVLTDLV